MLFHSIEECRVLLGLGLYNQKLMNTAFIVLKCWFVVFYTADCENQQHLNVRKRLTLRLDQHCLKFRRSSFPPMKNLRFNRGSGMKMDGSHVLAGSEIYNLMQSSTKKKKKIQEIQTLYAAHHPDIPPHS